MKKSVFFLIASAGFVLSFNVIACSALIPSIAAAFGVNEFFVGKIVWLYMLPYGLMALFYAPLSRSLDCKKILSFSLAVLCLANLFSGLASNLYLLFAARVLAGMSGAAIVPLSLILIAKTSLPQERGKRVGWFFSITFVATLLGLFLSGLLFWRWIFLIPAIGAALVCASVCFYFPNFLPVEEKVKFNYFQVLSEKKVFRLFVYIFLMSFLYHGVRQWLGVYFSKVYGFEQFWVSMLLTTVTLGGIFGESLGGILSDRAGIGRIRVVNAGMALMLFVLLILLFKNALFALFTVMFIWGLGWTFNHSGISTILTDLPHRHLYESAGLNSSVRFLSGGLGMVVGGILVRRSFNLEFAIFAFCLFLLIIFRKKLVIKEA
ncbi:MAG: MFS transporter [Candidatus Omnitrophota bacterium]|nr:MFS transporter [Candidatus Omnitrophota bacterium]